MIIRRIIVCGGRDFDDRDRIGRALDELLARSGTPFLLAHGGAQGADTIAGQWALRKNLPYVAFPADWARHGRAAGPIRNRWMLNTVQPDVVVAFPGGRGTLDMTMAAERADVTVHYA